jgi:adenosine deaminase
MQTKEALEHIATEHVRYLARDNRVYTETRFAPQYHMKEGLSLEEAIGYTVDGLAKGSEEHGVNTKLLVCIGREADEELSKKVVKAALNFEGYGVVGIDLACWENAFPPELHYEAFKMTFDSSLKRTVHAGEVKDESEGLRNIFTSMKLLRADGLGHAIALKRRNYGVIHDLVKMAVDNNVRIESCPRSNMTEGHIEKAEDLDLMTLSLYGLLQNITINSDDPEMWTKGSLTDNYRMVTEGYGMERDLDHLRTLFTNPIRMAFGLTDQEKRLYTNEIEESFAKEIS